MPWVLWPMGQCRLVQAVISRTTFRIICICILFLSWTRTNKNIRAQADNMYTYDPFAMGWYMRWSGFSKQNLRCFKRVKGNEIKLLRHWISESVTKTAIAYKWTSEAVSAQAYIVHQGDSESTQPNTERRKSIESRAHSSLQKVIGLVVWIDPAHRWNL